MVVPAPRDSRYSHVCSWYTHMDDQTLHAYCCRYSSGSAGLCHLSLYLRRSCQRGWHTRSELSKISWTQITLQCCKWIEKTCFTDDKNTSAPWASQSVSRWLQTAKWCNYDALYVASAWLGISRALTREMPVKWTELSLDKLLTTSYRRKFTNLGSVDTLPFTIETFGQVGDKPAKFLQEIGCRNAHGSAIISMATTQFAVQMVNAACIMSTENWLDDETLTISILSHSKQFRVYDW